MKTFTAYLLVIIGLSLKGLHYTISSSYVFCCVHNLVLLFANTSISITHRLKILVIVEVH